MNKDKLKADALKRYRKKHPEDTRTDEELLPNPTHVERIAAKPDSPTATYATALKHSIQGGKGGEGKLGYVSPQKETIWGLCERLGAQSGADLQRMLTDTDLDLLRDAAESTRDDGPLPMMVEGINEDEEVLTLRNRITEELKEVPFSTAVRYANEKKA